MAISFLAWWYSQGWRKAASNALGLIKTVQQSFALPVLMRTMFSPWKQIISFAGDSLGDRLRAAIDNFISRLVGFSVRFLSLIVMLLLLGLAGLAGLIYVVAWPLLPLAFIYSLVRSISG